MSAVETQTKKSGVNIKMLLIIVIVLFAMMLTTIFATYFLMSNVLEPNSNKRAEERQLATYEAGEILTNLSDKGYIKVSMVYLLDNKKVQEEIGQKDYEIRDNIFSILRSKKFNEVKDSTGMEKLRAEIEKSINDILSEGKILDVYFTSIIVN